MLHDFIDTSLLPSFPPEALEEVKREGRIRTLEPGEAIFTEGQCAPGRSSARRVHRGDLAAEDAILEVDVPHLEELGAALGGPALQAGLAWLETTLSLTQLTDVLVTSADRLTSLISAVRQYTYKDQDTLREVDVHSGLESTLAMFAHRVRAGVTVTRDYDTSLPRLWAHGNELYQVWTNLIENALDAMRDRGHLRVSTSRRGDEVHVEIADDGPGIPQELQARIWEPFFTTKALGARSRGIRASAWSCR